MNALYSILAASLLTMYALPHLMDFQQKGLDNTKISAAAQQLKQIGDATQLYIAANGPAIAATATPTVPVTITLAMLQCAAPTAGCPTVPYLPASFINTNPYGQTWVAETLQPIPGQLQTLIFSRGAATIPSTHLARIAMLATSSNASAQGGFVPYANQFGPTTVTTSAQGANWTLPLANYVQDGSGHLASRLDYNLNTQTNTYLNRNAVPGNPSLNTMNTPLQMGAGTVQTAGGACTAADLGKLARDVGGKVLMCDGANWKTQGSTFWQDAVANFAALPACNAAALNQTRIVQTPSVGTGPRAYTCDGTAWQPLGIDDNGNITISGTATVGAACSPNGKVAQDGTGLILSCQSGVWKAQWPGIFSNPAGWVNVLASRSANIVYTNTTGKPLAVFASCAGISGCSIAILVNYVAAGLGRDASPYGGTGATTIVPPADTYYVVVSGAGSALSGWSEMY